MTKTITLSEKGTGVLVSFMRHEPDLSDPRCEHALVFVPWDKVEDLLEAVDPLSTGQRGQPKTRVVESLTAAISVTGWDWAVVPGRPPRDDGFEPVTVSFRTDRLFVVNGPLPGASEADVTLVLNGARAGEALTVVLSPTDAKDFMSTLTLLWSDHVA